MRDAECQRGNERKSQTLSALHLHVEWVANTGMRYKRLKIEGRSAVYHCTTRTVNGAFLFDPVAKEQLRRHLWQVADFSGVEVLTYCVMSNHFHVLIRVPDRQEVVVSDRELLRRYAVLYPNPTQYQTMTIRYFKAVLKQGGREAAMWRRRLLARMHDLSEFMKSLKQRYTIWYNQNHDRYGTLWSERFKSTVVEGKEAALRITAAYIDLNPVRAGVVEDPKDYRWSGYGEAVGGNSEAREGIGEAIRGSFGGALKWREASREYRKLLYCAGTLEAAGKESSAVIPMEAWMKVVEEGGRLPVAVALRCRVRYFTDGAVLGSREFVDGIFAEYRDQFGRRRRSGSRGMKGSDWEGLRVARELRREVFG